MISKEGREMVHQLYVLQTLLFNTQDERKRHDLDPNDSDARLKLVNILSKVQ